MDAPPLVLTARPVAPDLNSTPFTVRSVTVPPMLTMEPDS